MSEAISFLVYTVMYLFAGIIIFKTASELLEFIGQRLNLSFYGNIHSFNKRTEKLGSGSFIYFCIIVAILGLVSALF